MDSIEAVCVLELLLDLLLTYRQYYRLAEHLSNKHAQAYVPTIIIIVFFAGIVIPYVLACPPLAMYSTMCCLDMLSNVLGECSGLSEVYL